MPSEQALAYAAYMLLKSKDDTCITFLKEQKFHLVRKNLDCPKENGKHLSFSDLGDAISFFNQHRKSNKKPNNFQTSRISEYYRQWSESSILPERPQDAALLRYWQQLHLHFKGATADSEAQRSDESESATHAVTDSGTSAQQAEAAEEVTSASTQSPSNRKRRRSLPAGSPNTKTQDSPNTLPTPPRRRQVTFATPLERFQDAGQSEPGPSQPDGTVSPSQQQQVSAVDQSEEISALCKENKRLQATLEACKKKIAEERAAKEAIHKRAQDEANKSRLAQESSEMTIFNMAAREISDTVAHHAQVRIMPTQDSKIALELKNVLERSGLYQDRLMAMQKNDPGIWSRLTGRTKPTLPLSQAVEFLFTHLLDNDYREDRLRIGAGAQKARTFGYCMAILHLRKFIDSTENKFFFGRDDLVAFLDGFEFK